MRFNIYQGDRLLFEKKFFYTLENAWNFCKYVLADDSCYPVIVKNRIK